MNVDLEIELFRERRAGLQEVVAAALRTRGSKPDRDSLLRTVVALHRAAGEGLPFIPCRRLVPLEPLYQRPLHQPLVEHHCLVVGAIAHPQDDQRAKPEVAVRLGHGGE